MPGLEIAGLVILAAVVAAITTFALIKFSSRWKRLRTAWEESGKDH